MNPNILIYKYQYDDCPDSEMRSISFDCKYCGCEWYEYIWCVCCSDDPCPDDEYRKVCPSKLGNEYVSCLSQCNHKPTCPQYLNEKYFKKYENLNIYVDSYLNKSVYPLEEWIFEDELHKKEVIKWYHEQVEKAEGNIHHVATYGDVYMKPPKGKYKINKINKINKIHKTDISPHTTTTPPPCIFFYPIIIFGGFMYWIGINKIWIGSIVALMIWCI